MQRRAFLKKALCGGLALTATQTGFAFHQVSPNDSSAAASPPSHAPVPAKIRGVNLGAWLVLEKWMAPDVYAGTDALDEYSLCLALGSRARAHLDRHRESFITADDFRWIAGHGLNAVRLPVGYWALEAPAPYVECARFIDLALNQSEQNGLKLLLDLHGAPGSQNGWDHSGRIGPIDWPKNPKCIDATLQVLEQFARQYGRHPALLGIELLNEPNRDIPLDLLKKFYQDAYARIRRHTDAGVAVVFHDSFQALAWKRFMREPAFANVILDTHLYQCFSAADKTRAAREQLEIALKRKDILDQMQREELPTIVGEWSLSLDGVARRGLSPLQREAVNRAYAANQLLSYESTRGWFFWSYKLQYPSEWNFRHCVERGWLPDNYSI